jgi:hypothetical protein
MNGTVPWNGDWSPIEDDAYRRELDVEFAKEIHSKHILHGRTATAIAGRKYADDVLFQLDLGEVAEVHLTWLLESQPGWPTAEIFPSFDAWVAETLTKP